MTGIHAQIVQLLRDCAAKDTQTDLKKYLIGFTDEQVLHSIFRSYRGKDNPKGLRLTSLGFRLLGNYVQSYEVKMPEDYRLGSRDLLYLDDRAKMPYYIGRAENDEGTVQLFVFEHKLGIMLKLADGMISNLRDMEA